MTMTDRDPGHEKEAMDSPFDGYGRPFSETNPNQADGYSRENPANNVGPYTGPSSYSINTVAPYTSPPAEEEANPGQDVGEYAHPGEGIAEPTEELRTAYKRWNEAQWFTGASEDIYNRVLEAEELRRQASSVGDIAVEDELSAQISVLDKVAAEYDDSTLNEFVDELPGGRVALEYDDLVDGGLVDIQSFLSVGAHQVAKQAAEYDWEAFADKGAAQWVSDRIGTNPGVLKHETMTRNAAIDYAKDKTMVLMDPARRAGIIDDFVNSVEVYRREAASAVERNQDTEQAQQDYMDAARLQRTAQTVEAIEDNFLPGSYTETGSDYDEDGYLEIGDDDGSAWYDEARSIIESTRKTPWEQFTTEGAREWFYSKATDNPSMLRHADLTCRAAKTFALKQASALPNDGLKNEIARAFAESVEFLRQDHERREASDGADGASDIDAIYEDEDEMLW